ncbi:kelch protein 18 [Tropilaelaps mercedesae]|uniref:Kelch protein 18 n=1 Tax=Tropilaelaps mercedesae TaxID=418985 RepID=A0A1V9Y0W9_9ACAR|nr:kelch protein 18 [Tropilaelaps mercedesae]
MLLFKTNERAGSRGYCNAQTSSRRSILESRSSCKEASSGNPSDCVGEVRAQCEHAPVAEPVRNYLLKEQRRCQHHQRSREYEAPDGQTYNVPLWVRLSMPCDERDTKILTRIEHDIKNQKPDMFVISRSGFTNAVNKDILCKTSGYFDAISRSGMYEAQSSTIRTEIEQELLRIILDYAYHGSIRLTNSNAAQIFQLAVYLQMESLVDTCCSYIISR